MSGLDLTRLLSGAFVGYCVAALAAYPVYKALLALNSRQTVSQFVPEHAAKQGTPTMGGIITGIGFLAACAMFSLRGSNAGGRPDLAVALLYLGFAIIGFVDDFVIPRTMKGKRGLGWTQKLVLQIVFALIAVWLVGPAPSLAQAAIAVFLVLFFSNAYNFADGMDWLAGLLLLAMVFGYSLIGIRSGSGAVAYLVALAASSLPFLVLNKPKAKLFMGDVGALPIGAVVGLAVAIMAMPDISPALSRFSPGDSVIAVGGSSSPLAIIVGLAIVSLMMVAELVPVPLQILSVKLRHGKRLFAMTPIHHGYQKKGWKETWVVTAFVGWQIVFSVVGVAATNAIDGYMSKVKKAAGIEHIRQLHDSLEAYKEP